MSDTVSEELSALPEYLHFIPTVIEVQKDLGGSGKPAEVFDLVLDRIKKTNKSLTKSAIPNPSQFHNDMQRVRQTLVHAGLLDPVQKGMWTLTERGLSTEPSDIDLRHMNEIRRVADKQYREKRKRKLQGQTTKSECRIEVADDPRLRLLNEMRHLTAADFIRICQEILIKSGFNKLRISGRNDDESYDGECIFQKNPLNRSYVLFRMKCDERLVEAEEIKNFRKAMTYCADKGIFMTTGFFSSDAKCEAQREGVSAIALMDKKKLVGMIERLRIQLKNH